MKIITIINQKGGVGKTTTAHALGSYLAQDNRVLFIDLDQQGNLSYSTAATGGYTSLEMLISGKCSSDKIEKLTDSISIISSVPSLASIDAVLTDTGKEYRLKEALAELMGFDYVVIDTPPTLNILTINALTASDYALIPAQADIFSLQGITQLSGTIETIKRYTNANLSLLGVVLTRHNTRSIINRDLQGVIIDTANKLHTKTYKTFIREAVAIREAQAMQQDIFTYAPNSSPSQDYKKLFNEVIEDINL